MRDGRHARTNRNPPSLSKAEQEGFEPPVPFDTTVFKTVALSHSATAPNVQARESPHVPGDPHNL